MSGDEQKTKEDHAGEWSDHFEESIRTESTWAKVVLSACYLDELLYQLLGILLKPNEEKSDPLFDGPQAPLSSFNAKIDLAARMGVIDRKTWESLHLVRRIRNKFAHALDRCDFNDPQIEAWNKKLHELNDCATERRRAMFSDRPIGDFEKSVSWLVYWIKYTIQDIPTLCPSCGSEMEHRAKIKAARPGGHG